MIENTIGKVIAHAELIDLTDNPSRGREVIKLKFTDGSELEIESQDSDGYRSWLEVTFTDPDFYKRLADVEQWIQNEENYREEMREREE